jgi:hypothetical protein
MSAAPRILAALAAAAVAAACARAAHADAASDAFKQIVGDGYVTREIVLSDLGFKQPIVMTGFDARQEIYVPVPADLPLSDATLQLEGQYLRTDGGRTTVLLSIDGYPVAGRSPTDERGTLKIGIGVDGSPRPSGFMRLGIGWSSYHSRFACDERTIGNSYVVDQDHTKFTYRYDGLAVRELATAWSALPPTPVVLVAGKRLADQSYDAAWRIGLALRQAGKNPIVQALPAVGDLVDLKGLALPAGLASLPPFQTISTGSSYTLRSAAEVGALMLLRSAALQPDIVIADSALLAQLNGIVSSLSDQARTWSPAAQAAFSEWRNRSFRIPNAIENDGVQLIWLAGRPVIAVAPQAAAKAAVLFDNMWRQMPLSQGVLLRAANRPDSQSSVLSLARLGGVPGSFEVLERGDWTAAFDIGVFGGSNRLPKELVMDVAVAPSPSTTPPVVSVFLNDYLLAARRIDAPDGRRQRLIAKIPRYSLEARNQLRVSVQRQPVRDGCREEPKPFPAAVLPSSHVVLDQVSAGNDFVALLPQLAEKAQVIVPSSYLENAPATLDRLIPIAYATGILPERASFTVSNATPVTPVAPFLALDAPIQDLKPPVSVEGSRLTVAGNGRTLLDVSGLDRIGVLEIANAGGQQGIAYLTIGHQPPSFSTPFRLSRGDVVIVGNSGKLAEIDTRDPAHGNPASEPDDAMPWYVLSRERWLWLAGGAALLVALALLGRWLRARARRRLSASD